MGNISVVLPRGLGFYMANASAIVVNVNDWSRKIERCDDTSEDLVESHRIIEDSKLAMILPCEKNLLRKDGLRL